jgi:hypothetical protein
MGLDLICGDVSIKMGSYRRVHVERRMWIEAYNKWVGESLIPIGSDGSIDIEALQVYEAESEIATSVLDGLKRFVIHSDCEGYWSSYDAEAMLTTLDTIHQYFDKEEDDDEEYYLSEIFKHSVETNEDIQFR